MRVAGKRVDLVRKPLPKDDPRRRCPDISKARRLLGFEPKTPIEFGLRKTYEDFWARLAAKGESTKLATYPAAPQPPYAAF
jgi:nucleoside-diphosphate-sugar epimerase